jgi:hypothetical protein
MESVLVIFSTEGLAEDYLNTSVADSRKRKTRAWTATKPALNNEIKIKKHKETTLNALDF